MPSTKKKPKRRNWSLLAAKFGISSLTLTEFCKQEGVSYHTARRHFKAGDRINPSTKAGSVAEETQAAIATMLAGEQGKKYVAALESSSALLRDIMAKSHRAFNQASKTSIRTTPDAWARVAMQAAESLRTVNAELQDIPTEGDDGHKWDLLKGFDPLPQQRDYLLDFPSNLKLRGEDVFIMAGVGGIGSGKSRVLMEKFGGVVERNRGLDHCIYAPTYRQLEDVTIGHFLDALNRKGISYRHQPSKKVITVFGDTRVFYRSMDNAENLRGPNLAAAAIDEGLQMPDRKAFDVIMGRIRVAEAAELCLMFAGSPAGLGWGYDILALKAKENKVKLYNFRTESNIHLKKGTYERLLTLYDEKQALQELEGMFIDIFKGKAYYNFTRESHVLPASKVDALYSRHLPLILMTDFNVSPMAWEVGQSFPHSGDEVTYIMDEIYIDTASTELAAKEFVDRYRDHTGGIWIYGDAAGRHRHTSATRTDYQIIEDTIRAAGLWKFGVQSNVGKSNPLHEERVKDVNARFRDAKGGVHLLISDKCEKLIIDFERVGFVPGTKQLDKTDPMVGHSSDGVGYYINREHAIRMGAATRSWRKE